MKKMLLALFLAASSLIGLSARENLMLTQLSDSSPYDGSVRFNPTKASINECLGTMNPALVRQPFKAASPVLSSDLEPIFDAPAGEKVMYSRTSYGTYIYNGMYLAFGKQTQTASTIVYGDDGYAYIQKVFAGWPTFAYLKCEIDGNRLTATLPQPMFYEPDMYDPSITHTYFATMLHKYDDGAGSVFYGVDESVTPEIQTISWAINDDGTLSLDMGYEPIPDANGYLIYPEFLFGLADENGTWAIAGDCWQEYTKVDYKAIEVPEDLELEEWTIVSGEEGRSINVAFDGDDVYVNNFSDYLPSAWFKGKVENNKVTFNSFQYVGEVELYYQFFTAARFNEEDSGTEYSIIDNIEFNYDAEKKIMSASSGECVMYNSKLDEIFYLTIYYDPIIKIREINPNPMPLAPTPTNFADYYDYYGFCYFEFDIPNINADEDLLDTSAMYYRLYFDDEPYTFCSDEHNVSEDMTDIPYNFDNGISIFADGISHAVYFYTTGFDTIGVRTFNRVDGVTYNSPMTIYDVATGTVTTGIDENWIQVCPKTVEYYTLQGLRIQNPEPGIYLKVETFPDGSRRAMKTTVR